MIRSQGQMSRAFRTQARLCHWDLCRRPQTMRRTSAASPARGRRLPTHKGEAHMAAPKTEPCARPGAARLHPVAPLRCHRAEVFSWKVMPSACFARPMLMVAVRRARRFSTRGMNRRACSSANASISANAASSSFSCCAHGDILASLNTADSAISGTSSCQSSANSAGPMHSGAVSKETIFRFVPPGGARHECQTSPPCGCPPEPARDAIEIVAAAALCILRRFDV